MAVEKKYDVFVSHASEDKAFADALAKKLHAAGLRVWYDKFTLRVGHSLTKALNSGLANSRFGVVILSPTFFEKHWTMAELGGLTQRQNARGQSLILPVWHGMTRDMLLAKAPMLADLYAANSVDGVAVVAQQVIDAMDLAGQTIDHGLGGYLVRFEQLLVNAPTTEHVEAFIRLTSYDTYRLSKPMRERFYRRMEELFKEDKAVIDYLLLLSAHTHIDDLRDYVHELTPFAAQISYVHDGDDRLSADQIATNIVVFRSQHVAFTHNRDARCVFTGATEWINPDDVEQLGTRFESINQVSTLQYQSPRRASLLRKVRDPSSY